MSHGPEVAPGPVGWCSWCAVQGLHSPQSTTPAKVQRCTLLLRHRMETHLELCIQHEVKSQQVKVANLVAQFVPHTMKTCQHDALHSMLQERFLDNDVTQIITYCEGGMDPVRREAVIMAQLLLQFGKVPHLKRMELFTAAVYSVNEELTVSSLMVG